MIANIPSSEVDPQELVGSIRSSFAPEEVKDALIAEFQRERAASPSPEDFVLSEGFEKRLADFFEAQEKEANVRLAMVQAYRQDIAKTVAPERDPQPAEAAESDAILDELQFETGNRLQEMLSRIGKAEKAQEEAQRHGGEAEEKRKLYEMLKNPNPN